MKYKLVPHEMKNEYYRLNISFDNLHDFFDQYGKGKRQGNGIYSRYFGYANDITYFWFTEKEYPFAFVLPEHFHNEVKYVFYIRTKKEI